MFKMSEMSTKNVGFTGRRSIARPPESACIEQYDVVVGSRRLRKESFSEPG